MVKKKNKVSKRERTEDLEFIFPFKGVHKGIAVERQEDMYSAYLSNVRPYDVLENKARGGQRPGLEKLFAANLNGPVIAMCEIEIMD